MVRHAFQGRHDAGRDVAAILVACISAAARSWHLIIGCDKINVADESRRRFPNTIPLDLPILVEASFSNQLYPSQRSCLWRLTSRWLHTSRAPGKCPVRQTRRWSNEPADGSANIPCGTMSTQAFRRPTREFVPISGGYLGLMVGIEEAVL